MFFLFAICLLSVQACAMSLDSFESPSPIRVVAAPPTRWEGAGSRWPRIQDEQDSSLAIKPTLVTLQGKMTMAEAFRTLGTQAGIKFVGATESLDEIALNIQSREFWWALDQVIGGTDLRLYPYGAEPAELRIVDAGSREPPSPPIVCYDGPFRVTAVRCESTKDYLQSTVDQTRVILGIFWEPHVRPIAIQLSMGDLKAVADQGEMKPLKPDGVVEATVQSPIPYALISLPFHLADSSATHVASLTGTMFAIIPSDVQKFQFEDLNDPSTESEVRKGGLVVRFEGWTVEESDFVLKLRLTFEEDYGALESFRPWISKNEIELNDGMGTTYKPVGLVVTHSTVGEASLRYRFQKDPTDLNLDYVSATNILRVPIKIDLHDLILP